MPSQPSGRFFGLYGMSSSSSSTWPGVRRGEEGNMQDRKKEWKLRGVLVTSSSETEEEEEEEEEGEEGDW